MTKRGKEPSGGQDFHISHDKGSEGNPDPQKKAQRYLAECQLGFPEYMTGTHYGLLLPVSWFHYHQL